MASLPVPQWSSSRTSSPPREGRARTPSAARTVTISGRSMRLSPPTISYATPLSRSASATRSIEERFLQRTAISGWAPRVRETSARTSSTLRAIAR